MGSVMAQEAAMHCDDVALLPRGLAYTVAHDADQTYLDVHTHTKFFTFQIPSDGGDFQRNQVSYRFNAAMAND